MTRAAIYVRGSADEAGERGVGLARQREQAEACAARSGWAVVAVYQDTGYSGSTWTRPALTRLVADAADGAFDVLIVARLDRLMSETAPALALLTRLDASGVRVWSAQEYLDLHSPEGRHLIRVGEAVIGQVGRRRYDPSQR